MNESQLKSLFNKFETGTQLKSYSEIVSGHINDTFLIETEASSKFVLQRINHKVFPDVPGLVNNKVLVSEHMLKKLDESSSTKVLQFISTAEGVFYYKDSEGNYWNMSVFLENSITYDTVPNEKIAREGGRLTGEFLNLTTDLHVDDFIDVIPKFHDMSFRYEQFEEALKKANDERMEEAKEEIQFCIAIKEEMLTLQRLKESGQVPVRITHNDTKISNILFDQNDRGVAMIDTDTVMPGIIHYDFGDAIRTICNSAAEDEKDLPQVKFNMEFYKSYYNGFIEGFGAELSELEKEHLPTGVKTMIFIMGIRFLTDFLNNDIYYKTQYENHNLVRSRNQIHLLKSFKDQLS